MKKTLRFISHRLEYAAFLLIYSFFCYIPGSKYCIRPLACLAHKIGIRKNVVTQNMRRVFGNDNIDERLIKNVYMHAGFVFLDFLQIRRKKIRYTIENKHILDELKKIDSAVIGMSCHLGNWEIMPRILIEQGINMTAVAKPMHNLLVNRFFEKQRLASGLNIVYSRRRGMIRLSAPLRKKHVIGFLMDQKAGKKGIPIPFFGTPALTYIGPADLSLRRKLPVLFAYTVRNPDGSHRLILEDLLRPEDYQADTSDYNSQREALLNLCNRKIEQAIKKYPEQWFWFHRRW